MQRAISKWGEFDFAQDRMHIHQDQDQDQDQDRMHIHLGEFILMYAESDAFKALNDTDDFSEKINASLSFSAMNYIKDRSIRDDAARPVQGAMRSYSQRKEVQAAVAEASKTSERGIEAALS